LIPELEESLSKKKIVIEREKKISCIFDSEEDASSKIHFFRGQIFFIT